MKTANNIEIIDFLNQFNWRALNCFTKPYSIISENLVKNSSYYYLLFRICRPQWDEFFLSETGISTSIHCGNEDQFDSTLGNLIAQKRYIILITNQFYNEFDKMYKKKHHEHPVILKGFDDQSFEYTLLDENYETSKNGSAVEYRYRKLKTRQLKILSCDISKTKFIKEGTSLPVDYKDTSFCYIAFKNTSPETTFVDPHHIVKKYKEYLPTVVAYLDTAADKSVSILKKMEDDPSLIKSIYYSYAMAKNTGFPHASNIEMVFKNHCGIISEKYHSVRILELLFHTSKAECSEGDSILSSMNRLIEHYLNFRELFFELILSKGALEYDKHFYRMYKFLDEIYDSEVEFYNRLVSGEWELHDI